MGTCGKCGKNLGFLKSSFTCNEEDCEKEGCLSCKGVIQCTKCGEFYCVKHMEKHDCESTEEDDDEEEEDDSEEEEEDEDEEEFDTTDYDDCKKLVKKHLSKMTEKQLLILLILSHENVFSESLLEQIKKEMKE